VENWESHFECHVASVITGHKRNQKCVEGHKTSCAERFVSY